MDELIRRQAAIDAIDKEQKEIDVSDVSAMYAYSKCKAIIKQLPSALSTNLAEVGMDDTISRQAAIYIASGYCHPANIAKELAKLPPAEPKRIRGKWIDKGRTGDWQYLTDGRGNCWRKIVCSECGKSVRQESNYCPNCGAKMEGDAE